KPTYGRVSRYGLVAFASSLDQIGPISRTVEDAALVLDAISGVDPMDATSARVPTESFLASLRPDVSGVKIGVPKELFGPEIDPGVKARVTEQLDQLTAAGAQWEELSMPSLKEAVSTYYIIAPAEASANLARFDGVRYGFRDRHADNLRDMLRQSRGVGFGHEVKRRIIIGTYVLSSGYYDAYYTKAQKLRQLIVRDFAEALTRYDVLITPTCPSVAFKKGDHEANPLAMYLADIATIPVNMAGLPAISVPCGLDNGLPVGLQIIGPAFGEQRILNCAAGIQRMTHFDSHLKSPVLRGVH
ncbi:Asp-tRNA(Asn)/Glu-tRNA(Gln) amidotransferase subunit GatA, partial [bacterium]|nr:Asp-tRNA(Asn)/Glu-tRNA(Gln) amidotransferase subunit GatA [bacterium]